MLLPCAGFSALVGDEDVRLESGCVLLQTAEEVAAQVCDEDEVLYVAAEEIEALICDLSVVATFTEYHGSDDYEPVVAVPMW